MHIYEVIKRPIRTEKTDMQSVDNQYTFEVDRRANKMQIKQAVEAIWDVDVVAVRVMNMPGKRRRHGRHVAHTSPWRKAVVTLAPGQSIDFFAGV